MKILLTFFINLVIVIQLFGQGPVFDISWFPSEGAQFAGQSARVIGVSANGTGTDYTWDYSNLIDSSNVKVTTYLNPSDTENPGWYPNANLASQENGNYGFYNTSASGVEYFGEYSNLFSIILTNPAQNFQMPFSFGTTFSDSLQGTLNFSGISLTRTGEVTFQADGYGTLLLPEGQVFENVLRYQFTENTTDEHDTEGVIFTSSAVNYVWISPECPEPLLRISLFSQQNGFNEFESLSVFYSKGVFTSTVEPEREVPSVVIFPNPSDGLISVSLDHPGLIPAEISVFDMRGQMVHHSVIDRPLTEFDFRHLPKGIYLLKTSVDQSLVTSRFAIF